MSISVSRSMMKLLPAALLAAPAAWAANPTSGELSDTVTLTEWAGSGPYVFPNVTPQVDVVCDPSVPPLCDEFTLNVNIPQEFRELEENQRESTRIGIEFAQDPTGQVDYDLYVYDGSGNLIGESATGAPGTTEAVTIPLKSLKDGSYSVQVIPYTANGGNYAGAAQIGKAQKAMKAALVTAPLAGSAPLTVSFDARALGAAPSATGYVFDFGDGSLPVTDADGVVEHTYTQDGNFLSRVRMSDSNGVKAALSAAQLIYVGDLPALDKAGGKAGGAFGFAALLGLFGLASLRRKHG